jgi:chitin disaccharide deacetylase
MALISIPNMPNSFKKLALCVDDFGLHAPSDQAILALAVAQKISGFSLLVDAPDVGAHRVQLRAAQLIPSTAIGLHLNFTERFTHHQLVTYPLKTLIVRSQLRLLDSRLMAQEIARQFDLFERLTQCAPTYVDGHEHVHAFPVIRTLLQIELRRRYGHQTKLVGLPALRIPVPMQFRGIKSAIIAAVGGVGLQRDLARNHSMNSSVNVTTNRDFAGVYDFTTRVDYAQRMHTWLANMNHGGLIMAHPALLGAPVYGATARAMELAYFQSDAWLAAVMQRGFMLAPFDATF